MQQLYINGVAVDMPADEIKIKVASNILADVTKVMTAHSYSVTLPRTMANDNALALAYVVDADTAGKSTHRYLPASLYVDGVPLFVDGRAVLNSVDEKGYSLNLFWGLLDVFDEIKRENLKLCDLPLSEHWDETWGEWWTLQRNNGVNYRSGMTEEIYDELDDESKVVATRHPWQSPYTTAKAILDKVAQVYGITFTYDPTIYLRLVKLTHPLTSLNIKCKDEVVTCHFVSVDVDLPDAFHTRRLVWGWADPKSDNPTIADEVIYTRMMTSSPEGVIYVPEYTIGKVAFGKYRVYGSANHDFAVRFHAEWVNAAAVTIGNAPEPYEWGDGTVDDTWVVNARDNGDGTWTVDVNFYNVSYQGTLPFLELMGNERYWPEGVTPIHDIKCDFELADTEDARVGDQYSHVRNYPAVGIMDYLKEIMAHTGACIVGSVAKPDSIHFAAIDEILAKEPQRLQSLGVTSIGMTIDDVARKNVYTHVENDDDNLPYTAEGVIYCDNETLEAEKTAFESKFKVPRLDYFKQWEVEIITDIDEEEENPPRYKCKWNKAGDYICGFDLATLGLKNTGQDFATIIAECYANYVELVTRPKVVEVQARLGILDLLEFDLSRPVYIEQLASAFIVVDIATEKYDTYKLRLVKI